jgi:uncharacterized protein (TIGR02391 family)
LSALRAHAPSTRRPSRSRAPSEWRIKACTSLRSAMPWTWPSADEALEMSLEELGMRVLSRLAATDWRAQAQSVLRVIQIVAWVREWDRAEGTSRGNFEVLEAHRDHLDALGEAWDWLSAEGLLARAVWINANPEGYFVTRRGREILDAAEPLADLRTRRRLGVELHPALAGRLDSLTRAGAFEQAAFDALRQVEVRVRELAEDPRDPRNGQPLIGVTLMQHAFGSTGPLADPEADAGERRGMMELFTGAFGAVRNPLGHRNVEWDDPTEAAEMVLFADLLMRQLDRVAARRAADGAEADAGS